MSKRDKEIYTQYRELNRAGWEIPNTHEILCRGNGGSESLSHVVAKTVAAKVCINAGYRVSSEVENQQGEADILAYGHESRNPIVIELENGLTDEVKSKKLSQYLVGPVREVYVIDLDDSPSDPESLAGHIQEVTGL